MMTAEEFIRTVQTCGYGTNDLIVLHEGNMHWQGISGDKGLGYAYGVNGKTTAYSNGICGNSGSRQDWGM